jgi:hypothetical protein
VDLADNGQWDNAKQRAQIADWAMKTDLNGGLPKIRANVEGWKLAESAAPAFEQHVTNFWMLELGVDKCDSSNVGALFAVKNKNSAYYAANDSAYTDGDNSLVRLICAASGDSYAWRFATDIEKDTAALPAESGEGAVAKGKIDTGFVYVKEDGDWRRGTELDLTLNASCVSNIKNHTTFSAISTDTTWYICVADGSKLGDYTIPTSWRLATETEADTAQFGIPETAADSIKSGHVNRGRFFVYENNGWRRGTENDVLLGKACLDSLKKTIIQDDAGQYFTCTGEKKLLFDGVTVSTTWRASTPDEADIYGWQAPSVDAPDSVKLGNVDNTRVYVYEDGKWRRGSSLDTDKNLGPCTRNKENNVVKSSRGISYKCANQEWREATSYESDTASFEIPTVDTARYNSLGTVVYVYDMSVHKWRVGNDLDVNLALGPCTAAMQDTIRGLSASSWYRCSPNYTADPNVQPVSWMKLSQAEYDTLGFGYCNMDYMRRIGTENWFTKNGVRVTSEKEIDLIRNDNFVCTAQVSNSTIDVGYGTKPDAVDSNAIQGRNLNNYYTYDSLQMDWVPMTRDQFELGLGGCTIARTYHTYAESNAYYTYPKGMVRYSENMSRYYLCKDEGGLRKWVPASEARYKTYGNACSKDYPREAYMAFGDQFSWDNYKYVCEADTFRLMTPSEKWAGTVDHYTSSLRYARCAEADEGEVKTLYVAYERYSNFVCKNKLYVWDGKESTVQNNSIHTPMHTTQWGTGAGAYNVWDGGGVVIGPRIWLTANLYADTVGAAGPYILNPEAESLDEIKKIGLYYSHEQAQAACASITYSGDAFRLPTPSDYKALYNQYAEKPSNLFSRDGWEVAGNDYFGLAIYPNGQLDDYGDETYRYKIGYYTDESKEIFKKIGYSYNSTSIIATLRTSEPDSVVLFWPTTWGEKMKFVEQEYAPVRCVLGDIPDPPTSND